MSKLTAGPIHANLIGVERATFSYFIAWGYVLLFLNLFLSVCKCAAITIAANVL